MLTYINSAIKLRLTPLFVNEIMVTLYPCSPRGSLPLEGGHPNAFSQNRKEDRLWTGSQRTLVLTSRQNIAGEIAIMFRDLQMAIKIQERT
jgi:hypothetical protein